MREIRSRALRVAVGLAVVAFGIVEVQTLVQALRAGARFRRQVTAGMEEKIRAAQPRIAEALHPGGWQAWRSALEEALGTTHASEAELFDAAGTRLLARPHEAPVSHWPAPAELERVRAGEVISIGPVGRPESRLLTYTASPSGDQTVLLRFSFAVPDLVTDLRERRQLLIAHAVAAAVLLFAGALALFPEAPERAASTLSALGAYQTAMERLRERGEELSERHEAERRHLEDRIRDKEAMARAGELTAGIVHELRNGLATILGYSRLLEHDAAAAARETARHIREECQTLEVVIRRFMEFVKRETLQHAPFDLPRLLRRVAARECRGRPGAEVEVLARVEITAVGDEELLERAFENVVRNAREAAGMGGHVWVDVARDGDDVVVEVADDGPGVPGSVDETLRPFFTTKKGGLGLGLPIALKIVELHHGRLMLAGRDPHGLRVTVRLPADASAS